MAQAACIQTASSIHSFLVCTTRSVYCVVPKHRHQSPEKIILSHINCFIQGEVVGFQVLLDSLHPRSTRASWWSVSSSSDNC